MVQRHYHLEKSNFISLCPWIVKVTFLSSSVSMIPSSPSAPFCPPLFLLSLFFFACDFFCWQDTNWNCAAHLSFIKTWQCFDDFAELLNVWKTLKHLRFQSYIIGYLILTEFIKHVFPRFFSPSLFLGLALFSSFDCWTELIQAKFRSSG